jgi:hypothetical protein
MEPKVTAPNLPEFPRRAVIGAIPTQERNKMKRLAITLALLCACAGLARGQNHAPRPDGNWWLSLDHGLADDGVRIDRSGAEGLKLGYIMGIIEGTDRTCKTIDPTWARAASSASHPCMKYALRLLTNPGVSCGQMEDGLNEFYQDYRNRSVLISSALVYVLLELQGASPETLDEYRRTLLFADSNQ